MSTGHLHLFRRDAIYYWRRRLPKALGAALGRSHLCRSMGTADPTLARRRTRRVSSYIDDLDDRLRTMKLRQPNRADLDRVLWQIFQSGLDDGEADRAMRPPGFSPWAVDDTDSPEAQYAAENQSPHDKAEQLRAALEMQDFSPAQRARPSLCRRCPAAAQLADLSQPPWLFRTRTRQANGTICRASRPEGTVADGGIRRAVPCTPPHFPITSIKPRVDGLGNSLTSPPPNEHGQDDQKRGQQRQPRTTAAPAT